MLSGLIHFLKSNNEAVSATSAIVTTLATVVLMLTTIVYAYLTAILARESRLTRRAQSSPNVVAYLTPDTVHINAINIVIANVGTGPAFSVNVKFKISEEDIRRRQVLTFLNGARDLTNALPVGEKITSSFGISFELMKTDDPLPDFDVEIRFADDEGNKRRTVSRISMLGYTGIGQFQHRGMEDIADSLKKIQDIIQNWSRPSSRFAVELFDGKTAQAEREQAIEEFRVRRNPPPATSS